MKKFKKHIKSENAIPKSKPPTPRAIGPLRLLLFISEPYRFQRGGSSSWSSRGCDLLFQLEKSGVGFVMRIKSRKIIILISEPRIIKVVRDAVVIIGRLVMRIMSKRKIIILIVAPGIIQIVRDAVVLIPLHERSFLLMPLLIKNRLVRVVRIAVLGERQIVPGHGVVRVDAPVVVEQAFSGGGAGEGGCGGLGLGG